MEAALAMEGGNTATNALIGEYATPFDFATPMRTPAVGPGTSMPNRVMQEAQALARLQQGQTPLLGGENPDISGSDFAGITPQRTVDATPNPIAAAAAKVGATPSSHGGATPWTQKRDALHLNTEQEQVGSVAKIKSALAVLPAPKGGYQLAPPEVVDEDDGDVVPMEEDATDREQRIAAEKAEALEKDIKLRSSSIQRKLPRPNSLQGLPKAMKQKDIASLTDPSDIARELVRAEMVALFHMDAERFPPGMPIDDTLSTKKHEFTYEEIEEAAKRIETEASSSAAAVDYDRFQEMWTQCREGIMFSPSLQKYVERSTMSKEDIERSLKEEYEATKKEALACMNTAMKIEQKVSVMLQGLKKRSTMLKDDIQKTSEKVKIASIDKACYSQLYAQEKAAIPSRVQYYKDLISQQEQKEHLLQERYKASMRQ